MDNVVFYESADQLYVLQSGGLWWAGPGSITINNLTSTTYGISPSNPTLIIHELPFCYPDTDVVQYANMTNSYFTLPDNPDGTKF
jgi:hypothetical protein